MNTGNNTAGKTAPERYVSEKAFEELPDAFQKLAELLGEIYHTQLNPRISLNWLQ